MLLQRQHFLLSYFKTLSVGPAGVELATSRVTAWCSTNWATGAQWRKNENVFKMSKDARAKRAKMLFFKYANMWGSCCRRRRGCLRELKQLRRRRQQKPDKFAYLTMKNIFFARFARAFFIFWHFEDVLVLSTTWNDLFCSCVDNVSIWWQVFNFVFLCPKRWFRFNSRIIRTHFSCIMTLNNWKMIAEKRSYVFRWRSRFRRGRVCLSSL